MNAEDRANELYWGSDQSVNHIADELDLSKGALYEMIRPLPAGLECPVCGAEVVHSNRTAKDRGRVDCPSCDWDGTEDEAVPAERAEPGRSGTSTRSGGDGRSDEAGPDDEMYPLDDYDTVVPPPARIAESESQIRRIVAGGALVGAAVGLALVFWARRR
ncbi:MAG: hypothetical protein PVJ80_04405 [Gemmatimonadota bacterium]